MRIIYLSVSKFTAKTARHPEQNAEAQLKDEANCQGPRLTTDV